MSKVESLEIIAASELSWLQADFTARIDTQGQDRTIDTALAYLIWHQPKQSVIDRRVYLDGDDPAYKLIREIIHRRLPDAHVWCAYQRQFLPHHVHVDNVVVDESYVANRNFSLVIPLMEDQSFKTFVWKKEFTHSTDLERYRNYFRENPQEFSKINNLSEEYWLDHCSCSRPPEFVDCHELDGFYQYRLGTVGMFPRIQMHASNNWKRAGFAYKDLVIVHVH